MKYPKDRVIYLNRAWQCAHIGFCPTEKAWKREMKRLDVNPCPDYPKFEAATNIFDSDGGLTLIVTIADKFDKRWRTDPANVAALLVHECVHVWQQVLLHMRQEGKPGDEIEAYSVQGIFMSVCNAYLDTRIRKC